MTKMRERHGIPDARKVGTVCDNLQFVSVTDGEHREVLLAIGTGTHSAGMSPEQARYIGRMLNESALRIEMKIKAEREAVAK